MAAKEQAPKPPAKGIVDIVGQEALRAANAKEAKDLQDKNPDADVRNVGEIRADDW